MIDADRIVELENIIAHYQAREYERDAISLQNHELIRQNSELKADVERWRQIFLSMGATLGEVPKTREPSFVRPLTGSEFAKLLIEKHGVSLYLWQGKWNAAPRRPDATVFALISELVKLLEDDEREREYTLLEAKR